MNALRKKTIKWGKVYMNTDDFSDNWKSEVNGKLDKELIRLSTAKR